MTKRKKKATAPSFAYAIRSFTGFLEGTGKAAHTLSSYRSDLRAFQKFLEKSFPGDPAALSRLDVSHLRRYDAELSRLGFRTNTRRRKLLTVRRLLRYLARRRKLGLDFSDRIPAPYKVERVPRVVSTAELVAAVRALPAGSMIEARNRALLWTLAETGCLVSDIGRLRYSHYAQAGAELRIEGREARSVPIPAELSAAVADLRARAGGEDGPVFLGFNKFGPLGSPISSRGVELLVKAYRARLGFKALVPRTFRHSAVVHWHSQGISRDEIQRRLGLKTDYSFRVYEPIFARVSPSPRPNDSSLSPGPLD